MRFKSPLPLAAIALLTSFMPSNAIAQDGGVSLMPNYIYDISVQRTPQIEEEIFSIRLSSAASVSGCFKSKPADIEKIDAGAVIYVELKEGNIHLDKKPSYGQFECEMQSGGAHTDIPFDGDMLVKNGVNKIEIKNEDIGKLFDIEIESNNDKLILKSELKTGVRIPEEDKKKEMHYWFYPENTLVLYTPNLAREPDSLKQLQSFAISRGLTPMHEILESFPMPEAGAKQLYFVRNSTVKTACMTK